jgi:hypothetical protein
MANAPFKRIRAFPLTVAIWRNVPSEKDKRPWYSAKLERSYKNAAGEYENTDSMNRDDMLLAAKLLDRAHTVILQCEADDHAERKKSGATGGGEAGPETDDVPF